MFAISNDRSRLTRFREYVKAMGLEGTYAQTHTTESIKPAVEELRAMFPKAGVVEMRNLLFHERDMAVSRYCVQVPKSESFI